MKKKTIRLWAVLFWLLVWQIASIIIGEDILLVSPVKVIAKLIELAATLPFWKALGISFLRISSGFFLALIIGIALAILSARFIRIRELLAPAMLTIKSIPVASFIILALIWLSSKNLAIFISFLMVLPVIYTNILNGINNVNKEMLEMAQIFRVSPIRRFRYIYAVQTAPFLLSACEIALGLCWKAGIAAEVIGMPTGTIGERLQQAKVYLETPNLFAWTLVIVIISMTFEKLMLFILKKLVILLQKSKPDAKSRPENISTYHLASTPGLKIINLSKAFGENKVFDNLSIDVLPARINTIMAPSGAGKTTLLRFIMGLEHTDSGKLEVTNVNANNDLQAKMPLISAVFQEDRLCENLSVIENIRFVNPWLSDEEIVNSLNKIGLFNIEMLEVSKLSGGMKRRIAILRALLHNYELLILDEPFKGLDADTKEIVISFFLEYSAGKTVLLITHDADELARLNSNPISLT